MSRLLVDLKVGEAVKINGPSVVTLEEKSGQRARLSIEADENVRIERPGRFDSGAAQARLGVRPPS